jgi:hypothetical protein
LSTEASKTIRVDQRPEIPANSVQEFVVCTNQSSFGDRFTLNAPELGRALGRSHVQGRVQIQFGERFGNSVPIHIALLPPAGLLDNPSLRPLQDQFPTRLSRGLLGHNEFLRFPTQSYYMDDVFLLEDPFDLALGAVDIRTGSVIGDLLHRGFIGQNMFFALVRVEPRTPKESFRFRGPAGFKRDRRGTLCYRFEGKLDIPYPAGFLFPNSNLSTGIVIGPDSALDPFMEIVAVHAAQDERAHSSGGAEGVVASTGTRFSYEYFVARDGRDCRVRFRYNDHSQNSQFIMHSGGVTAVTFDQSNSDGRNEQNMLTFAGFGILTAAASRSLRFANVQISTGSKPQYITIMIDGGRISNVNTSQNLSPTSKGTELCRGKTATLSK